MSKHVPGRINLDDFEGLFMRLVMIGAIVFIIHILLSDSLW